MEHDASVPLATPRACFATALRRAVATGIGAAGSEGKSTDKTSDPQVQPRSGNDLSMNMNDLSEFAQLMIEWRCGSWIR